LSTPLWTIFVLLGSCYLIRGSAVTDEVFSKTLLGLPYARDLSYDLCPVLCWTPFNFYKGNCGFPFPLAVLPFFPPPFFFSCCSLIQSFFLGPFGGRIQLLADTYWEQVPFPPFFCSAPPDPFTTLFSLFPFVYVRVSGPGFPPREDSDRSCFGSRFPPLSWYPHVFYYSASPPFPRGQSGRVNPPFLTPLKVVPQGAFLHLTA